MPLSEIMKDKLKKALAASRIALVGASPEQLSVGLGPLFNLLGASFQGEVLPVNPKYKKILGCLCYPSLEAIDPPPDLAILLLNQHAAVAMTERAGHHGVAAVTIVAGGFKEFGQGGMELEGRLKQLAEHYQMPVIGPNTLGFSSFHKGLHGIFWHLDAVPGSVAIISQSGGVGLTIANCLRDLECGLSHFIGTGNCSVVDFEDYLEVLSEQPEVTTFCLFIEGLKDPLGFFQCARRLAPRKPIVVYKAGKLEEVSRATVTHTGSLAGEYRYYQAMFRQAGILEAASSWETAVMAKALSMLRPPAGNRLCALTFTAGPTIVAMDRLLASGWKLPNLSDNAMRQIRSIIGEKTPVDLQNPVDLTGPGFLPHTYASVLDVLLLEPFDAYFLAWSYNPQIRIPIAELEHFRKSTDKPFVLVLLAPLSEVRPYLQDLNARGICTYHTPEDGAAALNAILDRSRFCARSAAATTLPRRKSLTNLA
jgi:acyl-CoA synthetase (NDP forming)